MRRVEEVIERRLCKGRVASDFPKGMYEVRAGLRSRALSTVQIDANTSFNKLLTLVGKELTLVEETESV